MTLADRIADTLTQHQSRWKTLQHPKRKEILVNVIACTGCEWIADADTHLQHQAEMVAALVIDMYGPEF